MTPRNNKRPTTGAPGIKMLISVSTVAAALGGWAMLSFKEPQPLANAQAPTDPTSTVQPTDKPAYLNFDFAPIPTLEPVATIVLPTQAPTPTQGAQPAVVYVNPTTPPEQAAQAPIQPPALRVVDEPPPPPPSQPQSQPEQQSQPAADNSAPPPPPVTNTQSSQG